MKQKLMNNLVLEKLTTLALFIKQMFLKAKEENMEKKENMAGIKNENLKRIEELNSILNPQKKKTMTNSHLLETRTTRKSSIKHKTMIAAQMKSKNVVLLELEVNEVLSEEVKEVPEVKEEDIEEIEEEIDPREAEEEEASSRAQT
jgi:predicted HAD superfamily phosphohydrolase